MIQRTLSIVALLGLLIIATACNMPSISSGVKDCGEDMQCFTEAAENCEPAKVVFPVELEMMGIKITSTSYQEIVGEEDGLCVFKILSEGVEVEFTEEAIDQMLEMGLTQEMIDEQIQMTEDAASQEQLNQICRVDTEHLAAVMAQWTAGEFSTEDWTGMECEDVVVVEE